jgi:transglutaminase-like putative cysteine protease
LHQERFLQGFAGMLIRIGYELVFELTAPTPMLLMLYAHPSRGCDLKRAEVVATEPELAIEPFIDCFGNRAGRLVAPAGKLRLWYDNVVEDSGMHEPTIEGAEIAPVADLPAECLQYLLASRYCEVDRLSDMAWRLFGSTPADWRRVQAVLDWVHRHLEFGYEFARGTKTAFEVCAERRGVCRDFMHLAITLLRALNVPARYATGYLGDIGVPESPLPMDFSAWLEVYLSGKWYTLDARHNEPRIGRVLMARGRDAVDVALTTSFGPAQLAGFRVWTAIANEEVLRRPPAVPAAVLTP